jgi:serine kinase of HPr protein (carbohydrate metabolism regulator)
MATALPSGTNQSPSIHASAVLIGARAVLIRGPAGSGKSRLALMLLSAAKQGLLPFARLVADDRAHVEGRARTAAGSSRPGPHWPDRGPRAWYSPPST